MSKEPTQVQKWTIERDELNEKVLKLYNSEDENEGKSETTIQAIKDINKQIEELESKIVDTTEWQEGLSKAEARKQTPILHPGTANLTTKSLSDHVLNDPQFKAWQTGIKRGDTNITPGQFGSSPPVSIEGINVKTLVTGLSNTSAGALIINDRDPNTDLGTSYRPLTILDVITVSQTNSDAVDYANQGTHTNAAAARLEATATADGTGDAAESAMVYAVATANVQSIAHFVPVTRRALADAGQLRTEIDDFLMYGVREEVEDLIVTGSGTSPNFTGVLNWGSTTTQAWDTSLTVTTRNARRKVKTTGRATPSAFVMHPADWQEFDLLQDNEARYYYGGPSQMGIPRLWGLPVVECEAMTQGYTVCADWRLAVLAVRDQINISFSDSHSDFFTRGLVALLAEMRAAFYIKRPAAFVVADLTA